MPRPNATVSLADLSVAGVRLRPYEAVTIVRALVVQLARGDIAGLPSAHVIRLSSSGNVTIEGPVGAGGHSVARAAQLLDSLLPAGDSETQFRVPGGLKLVVARALGTIDLPPFAGLDAFAEALARFGATDVSATIGGLVSAWEQAAAARPEPVLPPIEIPVQTAQIERFAAPRPLLLPAHGGDEWTVSDVRRARRATGRSLTEVSQRSRIPVALLRQLEWGYLANWPAGHYGRTQLTRYARAAELDEQAVIAAIAPLLDEVTLRQALAVRPPFHTALERIDEPVVEITVLPIPQAPAESPARRRTTAALAAFAAAALLAIALLPGWWLQSTRETRVASNGTTQALQGRTTAVASPAIATQLPQRSQPAAQSPDAPVAAPPVVASQPRPAAPRVAPQVTSTIGRAGDGARYDDDVAYRVTSSGITYSPSFASVGTAMFYHSEEGDRSALVRADTDSRGAVLRVTRIVDDSANNFHVRPSPDGRRIAFDSDRGGVRGVYVADADGRNVRRVSPDGYAAVPSWSPDGRSLAFVREEPSRPKVWNLWTLDLESRALRQITHHRYGQPWGGSWFPDGRRIAYSHEERLVVHDLASGAERVFRSPRRGHLVRTPAVSPDGRHVIFQVHRDGAWMLDLSDGSMLRVLEDATAEEYTWSPDGKRVAYHSRKSGTWGVWVMAPR